MAGDSPAVRHLWPLLYVRDIQRSIEFYTRAVGFELVGKAEGDNGIFWSQLERGGAAFMLQQNDPAVPLSTPPAPHVVFYFVCDDADEVFAELRERGVAVDPPVDAYYGMRQIFVPDPDGYEVVFESPLPGGAG